MSDGRTRTPLLCRPVAPEDANRPHHIQPLPAADQPYELVAMLTPTQAVDAFLGDIDRNSKSRTGRTAGDYRRILDKFTDSLGTRVDVTEITADHIRDFLDGYTDIATNTMSTYDSILRSFFRWLRKSRRIRVNPMEDIPKTRRVDPMDLDVTTIDKGDVPRLLDAAETWPEILTVHLALYTGARRSALAQLRLSDYNQATARLKFSEKGGKTIEKPVPDELRVILDGAINLELYRTADDYLIPSEGKTSLEVRDDRLIWLIVKRLGKRIGVKVHVHALRAAFATFYLETHPGDLEGLRELMGHTSLEVTKVYLRKLDRQVAMERVRDLSWRSVAPAEYGTLSHFPQIAGITKEASVAVGAGGFEPPSVEPSGSMRPRTVPGGSS